MKINAALVHIPRLRRYARVLAGDAVLADDLVQDTLERACQKWALWRAPANASAEQTQKALLGWLLTLMHNLYANQWQQSSRHRLVELDEAQDAAHDPMPRLTLQLDLERALSHLTPQAREVLLLIGMEQFSYQEAAQMLDVPVGTVMSRLSRAREQLRRLMEGERPATTVLRAVK